MMNARLREGLRSVFPRSLVRHKILGGALRGNTIVTSWHDYPAAILGTTEEALLSWFGKNVKKGETWLDIGAHYGYTAIALCRLTGESGRVYAFEPMLSTASCISRMKLLNNFSQLTVVPIALGDSTDLALDSRRSIRGMIDSTLEDAEGLKESFLVSRLDWLWPKIAGPDAPIDGVKIDVQGMEIHVLEGMMELARRHRPKLLVEFHPGVSRPQALDVIASMGYVPQGIAIDPLPGESEPLYSDRTYFFQAAETSAKPGS
jgi:FkbM family methyltransferase